MHDAPQPDDVGKVRVAGLVAVIGKAALDLGASGRRERARVGGKLKRLAKPGAGRLTQIGRGQQHEELMLELGIKPEILIFPLVHENGLAVDHGEAGGSGKRHGR